MFCEARIRSYAALISQCSMLQLIRYSIKCVVTYKMEETLNGFNILFQRCLLPLGYGI